MDTVCGNLLYFFRFGIFVPRNIWQPWSSTATFLVSANDPFSRLFWLVSLESIFLAAIEVPDYFSSRRKMQNAY
jgi:hypothetical protein